ncbi:MAG: transposase [Planctomycetota bacterium]
MSAPRQVLPGSTYLITRRCILRQFLIRPSSAINRIFLFCLANAAERFSMQVHAFCMLSNHYHLVITDPEARLPEFIHWFNEYTAKCVNALYDRQESVWASGQCSAVSLEDPDAILDKIVYTITNPVAAGLVRKGDHWPGLRSRPDEIGGKRMSAKRPPVYFKGDGVVPKKADFKLVRPPAFSDMTNRAFIELVDERIRQREQEIRHEFAADERQFLGKGRILAQSPFDFPTTREPVQGLNPRVACRDRGRLVEAVQRLRLFLSVYREAWRRFCEGEQDVVFPAGTYWLQVQYGVNCAAPT